MVKTYPRGMSNTEIDFDLHTTVRGQTPDDYYINFLPLTEVQQAWKAVEINAAELLGAVGETAPGQVARGASAAMEYEGELIDPAIKLVVSDPDYALGISKTTSPEAVANTYKPWLDLWRESTFLKSATGGSDKTLANKPLIKP